MGEEGCGRRDARGGMWERKKVIKETELVANDGAELVTGGEVELEHMKC